MARTFAHNFQRRKTLTTVIKMYRKVLKPLNLHRDRYGKNMSLYDCGTVEFLVIN